MRPARSTSHPASLTALAEGAAEAQREAQRMRALSLGLRLEVRRRRRALRRSRAACEAESGRTRALRADNAALAPTGLLWREAGRELDDVLLPLDDDR